MKIKRVVTINSSEVDRPVEAEKLETANDLLCRWLLRKLEHKKAIANIGKVV